MSKAVNSRVIPTQFRNGRDQGLPEYPIWNKSYILVHNTFHVCRVQGSDIPIVELELIHLDVSGFAYGFNG